MVRQGSAGFTYLTVLVVVAVLGGGLALVGEVWHTVAMREREAELLYVGDQYRRAIGRYYLNGPRQYPRALEDLLKDPRRPGTERYLRRLYPDPITGKEWGLLKAPDGGILGIHSQSSDAPLKNAGFRVRDQAFEGALKYSDWQFVYAPSPARPTPRPTPAPGAPAAR
jgi:type II secretory pathway pseudopilin PulG